MYVPSSTDGVGVTLKILPVDILCKNKLQHICLLQIIIYIGNSAVDFCVTVGIISSSAAVIPL